MSEQPETITRTVAGVTTTFHATTGVERKHLGRLSGEETILEDLLESLEPDDVFLDVGANVGLYTCFVAGVLPGSHVYAVEPHPPTRDRLRANLALDDRTVTTLDCALSDGGDADLTVTSPTLGVGSHSLSGDDHSVETVAGDALVERGTIPPPTVAKIDVEGAELDVLRGFERTIKRGALRLIYCEVHEEKLTEFGGTAGEVRDLLRSHGFRLERLDVTVERSGPQYHLRAERDPGHSPDAAGDPADSTTGDR